MSKCPVCLTEIDQHFSVVDLCKRLKATEENLNWWVKTTNYWKERAEKAENEQKICNF